MVRRHRLVCLAAPVTAVFVAVTAGATPPKVDLEVECPALDEDGLALLEARARAELATEKGPSGMLSIQCSPAMAELGWQPVDGPRRERDVVLDPDTTATVDILLDAIHTVLLTPPAGAATLPPPMADSPPGEKKAPDVMREARENPDST